MQNAGSQKIIDRFFEALYALKKEKIIKGKIVFVRRYGINSRNFWCAERNRSSDIFQVEWLAHMAKDYGVSARWLLTGKGKMFRKKQEKRKDAHQEDNTIHP
jgi:hypothetical protein